MIVVKVELWSAKTGKVAELGRTYIWNTAEAPPGDSLQHYRFAVRRKTPPFPRSPRLPGGRSPPPGRGKGLPGGFVQRLETGFKGFTGGVPRGKIVCILARFSFTPYGIRYMLLLVVEGRTIPRVKGLDCTTLT